MRILFYLFGFKGVCLQKAVKENSEEYIVMRHRTLALIYKTITSMLNVNVEVLLYFKIFFATIYYSLEKFQDVNQSDRHDFFLKKPKSIFITRHNTIKE